MDHTFCPRQGPELYLLLTWAPWLPPPKEASSKPRTFTPGPLQAKRGKAPPPKKKHAPLTPLLQQLIIASLTRIWSWEKDPESKVRALWEDWQGNCRVPRLASPSESQGRQHFLQQSSFHSQTLAFQGHTPHISSGLTVTPGRCRSKPLGPLCRWETEAQNVN